MNKIISFFTTPIVLLLLGSLILRLVLSSLGTLAIDQNTFIAWAHIVSQNGMAKFYNGWSDYLPGFIYVLFLLSKLEPIFRDNIVLLYKLPAIFGDIASGYLVYKIVREYKSEKVALFFSSLILLNPAILSNSSLWGQVDILTTLFATLSVYSYKKNWIASAIFLAIGTIIKPQAALAAFIILFLAVKEERKFTDLFKYVFVSGITFILGFVPFLNGTNIVQFVAERLGATLSQYPYTSINAFNFWGLGGFWKQENVGLLSEKNVGLVIFSAISLLSFKRFYKEKANKYLLLAVLFLANFLFFTRIHERHLLPTFLPLVIAASFEPILIIPLVTLSATYVLNMEYSYVWITNNFQEIYSQPLTVIFSVLNISSLFFIIYFSKMNKNMQKAFLFVKSKTIISDAINYVYSFWIQKDDALLKKTIPVNYSKIALIGIVLFTLITRIISLGNPPREYFDEVYHAFTAKAMLNGDVRAWEWWNENPPGFAFEWTHPPFAKEAMVVGMTIFGENSFGYRVPAALFGTGVCVLIYLLGKKLFGTEVGLLSAAVYSLEGLSLVMSRIGMNDIYLVFFLLLSLLLLLNNRYLFSSLALGFALSSKWTTFWFFPIILFSIILFKKKIGKKVLWYLLIPPIIYVACYIPMFTSGHGWDIFWGMQKQMWWYHTRLVATHPYTSPWWSWPFLLRPIWLYTSGANNGVIGNIYAFGNPLVFWGGFVSVIASVYYALLEKRKNLLLIIAAYSGVFIPWALSPRIMFLYHYFPAIPFLCIATGFVLYRNKKYIFPFLFISLLLYIYFYPHWTGIPVSTSLNESYFWLPGWR